ncbi:MAG TPA: DUF58 domain-containing protein [Gammaproteobacteria bacterium]|nr:DUF58 domain-containing protein [Gammaproteobacteria bacterium]
MASLRPDTLVPERMRSPFKKLSWFRFIQNRSGPFHNGIVLDRKRIYIIPTRAGLIFSLLLLLLLVGSINYEKSLGYALTFLLAGIAIVSLLATWRNLAHLELRPQHAHPVFAGDTARFSLLLNNPKPLQRLAIALSYHGVEQDLVDCAPNAQQLVHFRLVAARRGLLQPGHFRLYTEFPTGLFVAWTWLDLSLNCTVYPAPDFSALMPGGSMDDCGDNEHGGSGLEHFSHLAKYRPGDNISRISWKAAARTGELFSKCFTGSAPQTTWISWYDIVARDTEQRLSVMAAMIISAEEKQQRYGLVLPDQQISPSLGKAHYHRCLTALARF